MTAQEFQSRFLRLIALTWTLPPMVGFAFLLYIEFFTFEQLVPMITTPLMSIFVIGSLLFAIVYFSSYIRPLKLYLSASENHQPLIVIRALRYFPLHYWMMFLIYIMVAPAATILSLEMATDYIALPVDWFRIHLVSYTPGCTDCIHHCWSAYFYQNLRSAWQGVWADTITASHYYH